MSFISNRDDFTLRTNNLLEFLKAVAVQPALFAPGHTPAYSNIAFSLLGIVLERKHGFSFEDLFQKNLANALGMLHTTSVPPGISDDAVVPLNVTASEWNNQLKVTSP